MKSSRIGALAASAALGLIGSAALAPAATAEDAKACFRTHCGKSIAGHEGRCGGTAVADLTDETSCEVAGGDWTTPDTGRKYAEFAKHD